MDIQKFDNLFKSGWQNMTVAQLISNLSGLPPMMEVFINADGTSMFLNQVVIEQPEHRPDGTADPPFLRIIASTQPMIPPPPPTATVAEQEAQQAQRAMELSAISDEASRMPRVVE